MQTDRARESKKMEPRCVECGFPIKTLFVQYSPGNIRLMRCVNLSLSFIYPNFTSFFFPFKLCSCCRRIAKQLQTSTSNVNSWWVYYTLLILDLLWISFLSFLFSGSLGEDLEVSFFFFGLMGVDYFDWSDSAQDKSV